MPSRDEKNTKRKYRLPPCPAYDVEGMESWLTDLASEGLILEKDGFLMDVATFIVDRPQKLRYRLEAAPSSTSMWSATGGEPDDEAVALNAEYGWEYVAKRGEFYIYRTAEPGVRELNTDPQVQALAIKAVEKRLRGSMIPSFLWLVVYPIIKMNGGFLLAVISLKTWITALFAIGMIWSVVHSIRRTAALAKLRKRLQQGEMIDHGKDWKERAMHHRAGKIVHAVFSCLVGCLLIGRLLYAVSGEMQQKLSDFTGDVPFATLSDFAEGEEYIYELDSFGNSIANTVLFDTDLLAPVTYNWDEIATIRHPDGSKLEAGLYIKYHETVHPWLARRLAREYEQLEKRGKGYEEIAAPALDVDYVSAFYDEIHLPNIVMQKGNKMICVCFHQYGEDTLPIEKWAQVFAESIR